MRDSLAFEYHPQATEANLEGANSVILVIGGSSKGLGAAKISAEDENKRVDALIKAAHEKKIPVLVTHLGGEQRRGELSDPFNQLGAENATQLIVVKGGDNDGFFTKIAEAKKIPLASAENILSIEPMLKGIFSK
jgi:UDP-N-acetylmuramoylalanine-D-glutamate ligase